MSGTYEKYLELAEKALQKSRRSLDTPSLIELAYGTDTAHIGGSDMLGGILETVLDKIANEQVLNDLKVYGSTFKGKISPKEQLDKIDAAIAYVLEWEERRKELEAADAETASESLEKSLLPEGVGTEDVLAYFQHQEGLRAKKAMEERLEKLQDEILALEQEREQQDQNLRNQITKVDKLESQLQASANECAMISTTEVQ